MEKQANQWKSMECDLEWNNPLFLTEVWLKIHTPSGGEGGTTGYSLETQLEDHNQCNNKDKLSQKTQKTQQSNKV